MKPLDELRNSGISSEEQLDCKKRIIIQAEYNGEIYEEVHELSGGFIVSFGKPSGITSIDIMANAELTMNTCLCLMLKLSDEHQINVISTLLSKRS